MADEPPISASKDFNCVQKVINGGSGLFNKRKRSLMDASLDLQEASSLSLGLSCSMSSGVTMFSGKETEEHFSEVNIELSLAAGSVDSDVTRTSFPVKYDAKLPVTSSMMIPAGFQLVDDDSTTCRWKFPLLPPVQTTKLMPPFCYVYSGPNSVIPGSGSVDSGLGPIVGPPQSQSNSNVKKCLFIGCARGASGFCISHCGDRRCRREGCGKGTEGKTVFCKVHGGGRRCEFLRCTKSAEGRTDYCIGHGGRRRCIHE